MTATDIADMPIVAQDDTPDFDAVALELGDPRGSES